MKKWEWKIPSKYVSLDSSDQIVIHCFYHLVETEFVFRILVARYAMPYAPPGGSSGRCGLSDKAGSKNVDI